MCNACIRIKFWTHVLYYIIEYFIFWYVNENFEHMFYIIWLNFFYILREQNILKACFVLFDWISFIWYVDNKFWTHVLYHLIEQPFIWYVNKKSFERMFCNLWLKFFHFNTWIKIFEGIFLYHLIENTFLLIRVEKNNFKRIICIIWLNIFRLIR